MTGHLSGVAARFEEVRLVLREGENIHLITRQVAKHTIVRVWVWAPPTGPGCTLKAVGRWLRARVNSSCVLAPASASTCPKSMDTFHGMTRLVALRASRSPASLLGAAKASLCATAELVTRWRQLLLLRRQRCRACRRCHRSNWHISRNSSKISKRQCPWRDWNALASADSGICEIRGNRIAIWALLRLRFFKGSSPRRNDRWPASWMGFQ